MSEKIWALIITPEYRKASEKLPPRFRSQVARKVQDLALDPTPAGSKCVVRSLNGVYRLRAGDFRVFYSFTESVVQLLYLSRRDDHTYDDLDHLEIEALRQYSLELPHQAQPREAEWEEMARKRREPKPALPEPLPRRIDDVLLEELEVPRELWAELSDMVTVDALLNSERIPADIRMAIVESMLPTSAGGEELEPIAVTATDDLLPAVLIDFSGPIQANVGSDSTVPSAMTAPAKLRPRVAVAEVPPRPYLGNSTRAIGKDAKYVVKLDGTVQLSYTDADGIRSLLTVDGHDELVKMVNDAKNAAGATQGGGSFLINEYREVIVPTLDGQILLAGQYTRDLEFRAEDGSIVSPIAPVGIRPGMRWPGPHVGIKYTLAAGASDIRYERRAPDGTAARVCLSDYHDPSEIADLLSLLRAVRPQGGSIFVNEAREIFVPPQREDEFDRVYVGALGSHPWFPRES